jgi:selenocysteine lyase/cysteine desulfurase
LANVAIVGIPPVDLNNRLFRDYKIHASPVVWENIEGVRITPHVYTKLKDLDKLADALLHIADEKTDKS